MRLGFASALLAACAATQDAAVAPEVQAPGLRVMTFNLRYEGGDKAPNDWESRLPLAVE